MIRIEFGYYFEFHRVKRYQFLERKYFTADNCVMLCNLSKANAKKLTLIFSKNVVHEFHIALLSFAFFGFFLFNNNLVEHKSRAMFSLILWTLFWCLKHLNSFRTILSVISMRYLIKCVSFFDLEIGSGFYVNTKKIKLNQLLSIRLCNLVDRTQYKCFLR